MSRSDPSSSTLRRAAAALLLASGFLAGQQTFAAKKSEAKDAPPQDTSVAGEIVDCTDYILMGKHGSDRRAIQSRNIDSGMPACLLANEDGQLYLLISPGGPAKSSFQPTDIYIGVGASIEGTVYQKGALKAILVKGVNTAPIKGRPKPPKKEGGNTMD